MAMAKVRSINSVEIGIRPYAQESLLIDAVPEMSGKRLLCTSLGLAQFANSAAEALPNATVSCTYFDQYRENLARTLAKVAAQFADSMRRGPA